MTFSYLIRAFILLLPFYVSAEVLRKKTLKENPYQLNVEQSKNDIYKSVIAILFFIAMTAIYLANQIMKIDIVSIKFGMLFILMCIFCLFYTIWSWWDEID